MITKKRIISKGALFLLSFTTLCSFSNKVHAETIDLGGNSATVQTVNNQNIITTKRGKWHLTESTDLISRKNQTITLKNTVPVTINSIEIGKRLTMSGDGELVANNQTGQFGISVEDLKGFSGCGKKMGKLTGKGQEAGVRVYSNLSMSKGTLEAEGGQFGVLADGKISAICGAHIIGSGDNSGVCSQQSYVKTEHKNSLISGTSNDINSGYSAVHSTSRVVNAICGATIREIYNKPDFVITEDTPINIVEKYDAISRHMTDMENYEWSSEPLGVYNTEQGFLGSVKEEYRDGTIRGVRYGGSCCKKNKKEVLPLNSKGIHEVIFKGAKARYTLPVRINYVFTDLASVIHTSQKLINIEIGDSFLESDHQYNFGGDQAPEILDYKCEPGDFVVEDNNGAGYDVTYTYGGIFYEGNLSD